MSAHDPQSDPAIPPALRDSLQRLDRAHPLPNLEALDQSVLTAADTHFARRTRNRSRLRTLRNAAGIAASIALLAAATWRIAAPSRPTQTLAADTLDPSHPITILDAFHLARLLESHATTHAKLSSTWDVNSDGLIDQRDVDALAQHAVKVSFTPPSISNPSGPVAPGGGA